MSSFNKELYKLVQNVYKELENRLGRSYLLGSVKNKLDSVINELSNAREPTIITRELLENYVSIRTKLYSISNALSKQHDYSTEDLLSLVDDIEQSLRSYLILLKRILFKESIVLALPIIASIIIYLFQLFIFTYKYAIVTITYSLLVLVSVAALLISRRSYILSYTLTLLTVIIAIYVTIVYLPLQEVQLLLLVYGLLIATIITYMHSVRITGTYAYRERVRKAIEEINKFTESIIKSSEKLQTSTVRELEEEAKRLFTKLYGNTAEQLLSYKLNVLVMHGYKREDALKKIVTTLREILKYR
ncbi:MAG: hypothetical protein ABWW65_03240 [Thermoprotei archaeon]